MQSQRLLKARLEQIGIISLRVLVYTIIHYSCSSLYANGMPT